MEGTVEFERARAIREAALGNQVSEERAAELLAELLDKRVARADGEVPALAIITNDRVGDGDARNPGVFRLMPVERVDVEQVSRVYEWEDGRLEKVPVTVFIAVSEEYTTRDGRRTRDEVRSGPEVIVRLPDGSIGQYGAATALLARLLEPACWIPEDMKGIPAAMASSLTAIGSAFNRRV
ncbi:MAG: hypothetical protein KatS3mg064_0593 [Tepidiforma sp.]|nr:hypothetical protein [Tepidiforma sp.]GIW17436.1 MAG: hypothetical protein KatS3mg064_0593 [Tepidiforma sp.]